MSVKSKEELIEQIKKAVGDNTSDDIITLLEDVSDTLDNTKGGSTKELEDKIAELENKVKETDDNWRKKYTDRFYNPDPALIKQEVHDDALDDDTKEDYQTPQSFDELFEKI